MAKETWIQGQCLEMEACLRKNNSKNAYQLVKDLTTEKQGKPTIIQDKSRKYLTEEHEIHNKWTEYCSDLYNYETERVPIVLDCPQIPDEEHRLILREEVKATVKALKMSKSAGVVNMHTCTSRISPSRRRSYDRHRDLILQQELEDRRKVDYTDSVSSYHTSKERQHAAVLELQNHQPYQPS